MTTTIRPNRVRRIIIVINNRVDKRQLSTLCPGRLHGGVRTPCNPRVYHGHGCRALNNELGCRELLKPSSNANTTTTYYSYAHARRTITCNHVVMAALFFMFRLTHNDRIFYSDGSNEKKEKKTNEMTNAKQYYRPSETAATVRGETLWIRHRTAGTFHTIIHAGRTYGPDGRRNGATKRKRRLRALQSLARGRVEMIVPPGNPGNRVTSSGRPAPKISIRAYVRSDVLN